MGITNPLAIFGLKVALLMPVNLDKPASETNILQVVHLASDDARHRHAVLGCIDSWVVITVQTL